MTELIRGDEEDYPTEVPLTIGELVTLLSAYPASTTIECSYDSDVCRYVPFVWYDEGVIVLSSGSSNSVLREKMNP